MGLTDNLTVKTNHKPRPKLRWDELTDDERAELDYVDTDDKRDEWEGFRYRGSVYDLGDGFELAPDSIKAHGFDGWQTQSYFDGIAVQYFDKDGEYRYDDVVVAHVFW